MTPDRESCCGVMSRPDSLRCWEKCRWRDCSVAFAKLQIQRRRLRSIDLCEENDSAEIFVDRCRRRAGIDPEVLGRLHDFGAYGSQIPLRHIRHQHHGLRYYRLHAYLFRQARGSESCMEISGTDRLHRRVQHIFNLWVGDAIDDAIGGISVVGDLRSGQPSGGPCGDVVRRGAGRTAVKRKRAARGIWNLPRYFQWGQAQKKIQQQVQKRSRNERRQKPCWLQARL